MRTVVVTGASGTMGRAVVNALLERGDLTVVALAGPERAAPRRMAPFRGATNLTIEYGDICDGELAARLVAAAHTVLHCAALIPPASQRNIRTTIRVNVGGLRTWLRAIQALPPERRPAFINIGTVAQTGDRNPPLHWGRVGDPIKLSAFDDYGMTKAIAEWSLLEARLERWTSLRQTAILYPTIARSLDPLMFEFPLGGTMEWVTADDTGRLAAAICGPDAPPQLWGRVFNIGGGASARVTNYGFYDTLMRALGGAGLEQWTERRWFATRNAHGQWFADSDDLADIAPFRGAAFDLQLADIVASLPATGRAAGAVPTWLMRQVFRYQAHSEHGTMRWFDTFDGQRIAAFFGSRRQWREIGDWRGYDPPAPSRTPRLLELGFDASKEPAAWIDGDLKEAAAFRGGEFLGWDADDDPAFAAQMPRRRAWWTCRRGHEFHSTPLTILHAGYWCPTCLRDVARYDRLAAESDFFAQVYPTHPA